MSMDIASQINAVTREISSREHNGRPARVMVASRTYETTIEDVWDAITNAERIPRWFLPISGELRLGGRYQLEGNAGGEITQCEPPRRLGVTWEFGGDVSWVDVRLTQESEAVTKLELEHIAHVPDEMWDQFGPGAVGVGWDMTLFGLERHLSTGESVPPGGEAAWVASEEGRTFVGGCSDAWREASVAAGTDESAAAAAAERTTAFYTGTGETGG